MTLCPIAIAIGCKKCPIFKICPAKGIIGDAPQKKAPKKKAAVKAAPKKRAQKKKPASKKKPNRKK